MVPPSMFLGDREERIIIRWIRTEKALFFKKERSSPPSLKPVPENSVSQSLTAAERREVEECTKIFENIENIDAYVDEEDDFNDLPNFSVRFDFLSSYLKEAQCRRDSQLQ